MSKTQQVLSLLAGEVASYMTPNLRVGLEGLNDFEIEILCRPRAMVYVAGVIRELIDVCGPYHLVTLNEKLVDEVLAQPVFRSELREESGLTPEQAAVALVAIKHVLLNSNVFSQPIDLKSDDTVITFKRS